jgi:hypothetical protein
MESHIIKRLMKEGISTSTYKLVISNPVSKNEVTSKIVITRRGAIYQSERIIHNQAFHENIDSTELIDRCCEVLEGHYRQLNAWTDDTETIVLIPKSGKPKIKRRSLKTKERDDVRTRKSHDDQKKYLISEGTLVEPLIDMGVFTQSGHLVKSMGAKFRQINRFLEQIDDGLSKSNQSSINFIDFGCGKSYLTFVVYYYLTVIKGFEVHAVGLDLKADVIANCNEAARRYGYDGLIFGQGDINGYQAPFDVDMVITLHACDTATDYALYNAIKWNAQFIFSVPCCQHELNGQMQPNELGILARYGIVKERFAALSTDAIRANLLEACGYKTQLLEFVGFEHTPKNVLIRAIRRSVRDNGAEKRGLKEANELIDAFSFDPKLLMLLRQDGLLPL